MLPDCCGSGQLLAAARPSCVTSSGSIVSTQAGRAGQQGPRGRTQRQPQPAGWLGAAIDVGRGRRTAVRGSTAWRDGVARGPALGYRNLGELIQC